MSRIKFLPEAAKEKVLKAAVDLLRANDVDIDLSLNPIPEEKITQLKLIGSFCSYVGGIAGDRFCRDWQGSTESLDSLEPDEKNYLAYQFELNNSFGEDYEPDYFPYDELYLGGVLSVALLAWAEELGQSADKPELDLPKGFEEVEKAKHHLRSAKQCLKNLDRVTRFSSKAYLVRTYDVLADAERRLRSIEFLLSRSPSLSDRTKRRVFVIAIDLIVANGVYSDLIDKLKPEGNLSAQIAQLKLLRSMCGCIAELAEERPCNDWTGETAALDSLTADEKNLLSYLYELDNSFGDCYEPDAFPYDEHYIANVLIVIFAEWILDLEQKNLQ